MNMNNCVVIVSGAQGVGKSTIAEALLARGLGRRVVEEWDGRGKLEAGDIAVTNLHPVPAIPGAVHVQVGTSAA